MLAQELIRKKREGEALGEDELRAFFYGFLAGKVADYQVTAMLMAIFFKGMTPPEGAALTRVMRDSGDVLSWPEPKASVVDKHSTGGVGDKTSLVVLPLVVLEGVRVPMIAGRGLGHTGGTLDKLEAVGWNVRPTEAEARKILDAHGGFIIGQTERIAPLDRKLYALRDVTATIESTPLIVGSILSKKLAAGLGGLVMDVKFGSGAFMRDLESARTLARALKAVGEGCGLAMRCFLTGMSSPLGDRAGNALEVQECLEVLAGKGPADTRELSLALATEMVRLARPTESLEAIRKRLEAHLGSGAALKKFLEIARAQGADLALLENPASLSRPLTKVEIKAERDGHIASIDVRALGLAVVELGGGRRLVTDAIEPWGGLTQLKRVGHKVERGAPLAVVHAEGAERAEKAAALVRAAYRVGEAPAAHSPDADVLIKEIL